MEYNKNYVIIGIAVGMLGIAFLLYKKMASSKDKLMASKEKSKLKSATTKTAGSLLPNAPAAAAGGTAGAAAGAAAPGTIGGLDIVDPMEDNYEFIDTIDYEKLSRITQERQLLKSDYQKPVELEDYPVLLRKHDISQYVILKGFRAKMTHLSMYGFWKDSSDAVRMTFKLTIAKENNKYEIHINKHTKHTVTTLKSIEIITADNHTAYEFIINGSATTRIPNYYSDLQYLVIESDAIVKYMESESRLK